MARIDCECMAVIPARSGSKGLPGKNIKELCGKPLLAWTIEAALESSCFDKVLVSTDSLEYGAIAKAWGQKSSTAINDWQPPLQPLSWYWKTCCETKSARRNY